MAEEPRSRKVRGTAEIFADSRITFRPQAEGQPTQIGKKQMGRSSLYKTTSEKEPQMVAHLSVDAGSADPAACLYEELEKLTEGMRVKEPRQPRGRLLIDRNGLRIFANASARKIVVVQEIDCTATPNYERFMLTQMQEIFKCFTINQASLARLSSAPKKSSRS